MVASRLPLRTRYLMNWDAAQFALGLDRFDLVHHQPHPPGYLGYIVAGRLLKPIAGDANSALVALSIGGECLGVVLAMAVAREIFGGRAALVAGLVLAASPLFWFYGEIANTYALEPALVLLVAWPAWRAWRGSAGAAHWLGLALGLAGALRPSSAMLMLPLAGLAFRRCGSGSAAARGILAGAVLTLAWVVPLLVLAGGPLAYAGAALELGGSVTAGTALWRAGPGALATTSGAVALGTAWELGLFAAVLCHGLLIAPRLARVRALPAGWPGFAAAWTLPALVVFLFVHVGQVVYVQVFTTALVLAVGPAVERALAATRRPGLLPAVVAAGIACDLALFALPGRDSLVGRLGAHDAAVAATVALVSSEDPARTVLVADAFAPGSYRMAQVYLPRYRRVAIAPDDRGRLGQIFADRYEPWRFARSQPPAFPPGADTFVFLDRSVVDGYVGDPERLQPHQAGGARLYTWRGAAPVVENGRLWLGPPYTPSRGRDA